MKKRMIAMISICCMSMVSGLFPSLDSSAEVNVNINIPLPGWFFQRLRPLKRYQGPIRILRLT